LVAKSREYLQINNFTTEFLCVLYLPRTCVFASRDYEPKRTVLGSAGYVLCDAPELLKNAQAMFQNAAGRVPSLPHQQILKFHDAANSMQLWPWLPVIAGYSYGIIHSINGVTC